MKKTFGVFLLFFLILFIPSPSLGAQVSCTADKGKGGAPPGHKCIEALPPVVAGYWNGPSGEDVSTSFVSFGPPTSPDETEVQSAVSGSGTVGLQNFQFTYMFEATTTTAMTPGADLRIWGGYGSKSSFEPYSLLFEGPRMWGEAWRDFSQDFIPDPRPGEAVTRICPYGLKVVSEYEERVPVVNPFESKSSKGTRTEDDYDYVYAPSADGTRLVYEHHVLPGGEWKGIWFREFPDGSRFQYELCDNQYPTKIGPGGNGIDPGPWYRIDRLYKGPFDSPYWEIDFVWKTDGSDRLEKIMDSRGVEYLFTWNGSGDRVIGIDVGYPQNQWPGTPSNFHFRFEYDSQKRLIAVIYPKRAFTYDADHDLSYETGEDYNDCPAVGFSYDESGGYTRITHVYNEIWKEGLSGSRILQETLLEVEYDSTYPWLVKKETEAPGTALERIHTFTWTGSPEGTSGTLTWTEPMGVKRVYEWQEWPNVGSDEGHPVLKRSVVKVKRIPGPGDPRPTTDPDHHGTLVWDITWDYLKITRIEGPYEEGKAPGQPLKIEWTYDSEGRNLPTSVSVTSEGGTTTLTRNWEWESWGDPWAPWDTSAGSKRKASRLKRYQDAKGRVWTFDHTFVGGKSVDPDLVTTVTFPQVGTEPMTCHVKEDVLGRVVEMDEPFFEAWKGDPPGPLSKVKSKGVVQLAYGEDPSDPGYGLLSKVTLYRNSDGDGNPSDPLEFTLKYTGLGYLQEMKAYKGTSRERTLKLIYDDAGEVKDVYLPKPEDGDLPGNPDLTFTRDATGRVLVAKRRALKKDGTTPYPNQELESRAYYDNLGRLVKTLTEKGKMDDGGAPQWLETRRVWDAGDRLIEVKGPMKGDEPVGWVKALIDHHGYPYKIERMIQEGVWATRTYWYTHLGALRRTEDSTGYLVEYKSDKFGRIDEYDYKGAGSRDLKKRMVFSLNEESELLSASYYLDQDLKKKHVLERDGLGRVYQRKTFDGSDQLLDVVEVTFNGLYRVAKVRDLKLGTDERGIDWYYDPMGRVIQVEDTLSATNRNAVRVKRDEAGDVVEVWELAQVQKADPWGEFDQPKWYRTEYKYDFRSRLTKLVWHGLGETNPPEREYEYDGLDRLVWARNFLPGESSGHQWKKGWEWEYDALGRILKKKILPAEDSSLNPIELVTEYVDFPLPEGTKSGTLHPVWGFVLKATDALGHVTSWHYDRGGRLVERRMPGWKSGSGAFRWLYEYDSESRLLGWTDGNGAHVKIDYDPVELRPTARYVNSNWSHLSPMTTREEWGYDDFGRVTSARTRWSSFNDPSAPNLVLSTASWDVLGRLETEGFQWADAAGAVYVQSGWNLPGGGGKDPSFRRSLTTASGFVMKFTPDLAGKLKETTLTAPGNSTAVTLANWRFEGGRVLGRKIFPGSGTDHLEEALSFDNLGYLTGIHTTWSTSGKSPDQDRLVESLTRDKLGNILKIEYPRATGAGDMFKLDGFERLVEAKLGVPQADMDKPYDQAGYQDRKIAYALDQAHNRDKVDIWEYGGPHSLIDYLQDPDSNRYTQAGQTALSYDSNGNLTFDGQYVYVYDYLDRLCEVWEFAGTPEAKATAATKGLTAKDIAYLLAAARSKYKGWDILHKGTPKAKTPSAPAELVPVAYYGYDPYSRRVLKSFSTGSWWYTWDGWRRVDEYYSSDNATFQPHRAFFDGRGIDEHLGYAVYTPGTPGNPGTWTRYTYLQGSLGNIRAVVDDAGQVVERYDYDPYGRRRVYAPDWTPRNDTTIENDYGYSGRTHDIETGLVYFRYRYYHPTLGRFLTQDPIGNWSDASNWGNGYAYVASMPNQAMDPFGLQGSLYKNALGGRCLKARMHAKEVPDLLNGGVPGTDPSTMIDVYPPPGDMIEGNICDQQPPSKPKTGSCQEKNNKNSGNIDNSDKKEKKRPLTQKEVDSMIDSLMKSTGKSFKERLKVYRGIVKKLVQTGHLIMDDLEVNVVAETTADVVEKDPTKGVVAKRDMPGMSKDQVIKFDPSETGKILEGEEVYFPKGISDLSKKAAGIDILGGYLLHELVHANQCGDLGQDLNAMEAEAWDKQKEFYDRILNNPESLKDEDYQSTLNDVYERAIKKAALYRNRSFRDGSAKSFRRMKRGRK